METSARPTHTKLSDLKQQSLSFDIDTAFPIQLKIAHENGRQCTEVRILIYLMRQNMLKRDLNTSPRQHILQLLKPCIGTNVRPNRVLP